MLVLSRKLGERIVVPQCDLSVAVLSIQGNAVRLGISAPPDLAIHREELWQAIHAEENGADDGSPKSNCWDALAADLSDTTHQIALRHGRPDASVDLETDLWQALAATVKNWAQKSLPEPDRSGDSPRPAALPR